MIMMIVDAPNPLEDLLILGIDPQAPDQDTVPSAVHAAVQEEPVERSE